MRGERVECLQSIWASEAHDPTLGRRCSSFTPSVDDPPQDRRLPQRTRVRLCRTWFRFSSSSTHSRVRPPSALHPAPLAPLIVSAPSRASWCRSMVLKYLEAARLSRGHSAGITALAFSPRGTYIASAGLDGKVCVWRSNDYDLIHVISRAGDIPVLSVAWLSSAEDRLICGLKDGGIVCCHMGKASDACR